jgi:NAD(P)-dependent dehydrogenase (short-subunit alcohol dehydrogenase family)
VTTTLNTGANKGLGFETARQLVAAGHQVWIGARDSARGRQAADDVGARFVQLDVTDDASVAAAAKTVEALDVLVNNAGISGGRISPSEATADDMRRVYETNVFGPVRVLHAFLPLLEDSEAPVVVNVSSGVGSLGLAADPAGPWTEANYPQHRGAQTIEQGAEAIVRYALINGDGPTGASSIGTAPKCGSRTERRRRTVPPRRVGARSMRKGEASDRGSPWGPAVDRIWRRPSVNAASGSRSRSP